MKFRIFFIIVLLLIPYVNAASIHGKVYDFGLEPINDVVVNINTVPKQSIVSKDGVYEFNVDDGKYLIIAEKYDNGQVTSRVEENIIVNAEGDYVLDLILFPVTDYELEELYGQNEDNIDIFNEEKSDSKIGLIIVFIVVLFGLLIYFLYRKNKKIAFVDEDVVKSKIYNIIKKEKRITQKNIRKNVDLSEAKISLVIAELENEGKIKKIKKGRGNIIVLK